MNKLALTLALTLALLVGSAGVASAHFMDGVTPSVVGEDEPNEVIKVYDGTDNFHYVVDQMIESWLPGDCQWDGDGDSATCPGVEIQRVSSGDESTLWVFDRDEGATGWNAAWFDTTSTSGLPYDEIEFNEYYMLGYTDDENRSIGAHEFGHSLGFAHPKCSFDRPSIMKVMRCRNDRIYPTTHDKNDYDKRWITESVSPAAQVLIENVGGAIYEPID